MASTFVGMPFRKELVAKNNERWVVDTTNAIARGARAIIEHQIEAENLAAFDKRLH